jgi:hypothetical protein
MSVSDRNIAKNAKVGLKHLCIPLVVAASQTDRPFFILKPGYQFRLTELSARAIDETGAVTCDALICSDDAVIKAGALTVHATPEDLALALSRYLVGGKVVEKAAETGIGFTAAHVITALKHGIITVQIDNAGTVSTVVPAATQAYDTAAEALAAVPAADSGKLKIAHILIEAGAADWDANTDDMTAASDLTAITITMVAAASKATTGAIAFADLTTAAATLDSDRDDVVGSASENLVLVYTSDGTGALVNGFVNATIRPVPMNGER